eukprot:jgi/Chrzof1/13959/Cz08g19130.t1
MNVTTHALREIERAGGLDKYLLKTPDEKLFSDVGSDLKFRIQLVYRQQWQQKLQKAAAKQKYLTPDQVSLRHSNLFVGSRMQLRDS